VKQNAQPCLYINRINSLVIPLPPTEEQDRIVRKVDEVLAQCEEIEARLTKTTATRFKLFETTLQEALAL
jgi:restriction endonuclease S subunit